MKKVLIPTKLNPVAADLLTQNGHYTVVQDETRPLPELAVDHADAYALIVRSEKVTAAVIDALPALRIVVRAGSGYNTIDTLHARKKGIDVMNTPGANANAVAEEVIGMILADARHILKADPSVRSGHWEKKSYMGRELAGKAVGIVGLGNIGRTLARRLAGFECRLLGYDPVIAAERAADYHVKLVDLPTLFAESDVVTLHLPENDDTRGMVNANLLARMKDGATIVNCARAGIVDEEALRDAKRQKGLRFLNDVYPKDEAGEKTVADIADLMLPHLGASTYEANVNAARRAAEQLIDLDQKGVTSYVVNRDIPEGLDEAYCDLAYTLARLCRRLAGPRASLKLMETSIYGTLAPYADWLLVSMVAGIWEDFERTLDCQAARTFLADRGIEYINREVDPNKAYEASITVDLTSAVDARNLQRVSVRGTVTEGALMIARINQFDRLYFEPAGQNVLFLYEDRPGVIGAIGIELAAAGLNIADIRNAYDPDSNHSLAIMKVSQRVGPGIVEHIARRIDAIDAHALEL